MTVSYVLIFKSERIELMVKSKMERTVTQESDKKFLTGKTLPLPSRANCRPSFVIMILTACRTQPLALLKPVSGVSV